MKTPKNQQPTETEKLKEIPEWANRYAQNRTIPFILSMAISVILFLSIAGSSLLAAKAHRSGSLILSIIGISILALSLAATFILSIPRWGTKFTNKITNLIYRKEGQVFLAANENTKKQQAAGLIIGIAFAACVLASVILGMLGYIPIKYMQPVSAVYIVPFIITIGILQKPSVNPAGFLSWLWPTLYAIHAILVVAGIPIQFNQPPWIFFNMLIPIAGYGILCGLIGHIYSRHALKKLKKLARLEGAGADGD